MDDVWTGKTDPVARRKRQNRLNQRAYSGFKVPILMDYWSSLSGSFIHPVDSSIPHHKDMEILYVFSYLIGSFFSMCMTSLSVDGFTNFSEARHELTSTTIGKRKLLELEAKGDAVTIYTNSQPARFRYQLVDFGQLGFARPPSSLPRTRPMMPYASPDRPAMIFPLPADHLLTLIQYNVLRAMVTNMTIVPMVQRIPIECRAVLSVAPSRSIFHSGDQKSLT